MASAATAVLPRRKSPTAAAAPAPAAAAIRHLAAADERLAALIARVGSYRMQRRAPDCATLARCLVYQQLSGKAAATIFARLEAACGGAVGAAELARIPPARLRKLGLSRQKARYLGDLAERTLDGRLDFARLPGLADDAVTEALTEVKGIGVWTAQMFLMFALRRPDVLPTGDLGIQKGMRLVYGYKALPKPRTMERVAAPWRPYRSVACWYLWRSLDGQAAL